MFHSYLKLLYQAIASGEQEKFLKPILRPYDYIGSTKYVDFDTTRPVYVTNSNKCPVSHVVADTNIADGKIMRNNNSNG